MNERQYHLFELVVNHYIKTAEPVGSKFLVAEGGLDWSEATVRNDLRALEEDGFLTHPHTSAGRIPTSKGFRQYLNNIDWTKGKLSRRDESALESAHRDGKDLERQKKEVAKTLVELTSELVLVTFSLSSFYYTGLSSLFAQPEFKDVEEITNFSRLFDQFERCVQLFAPQAPSVPTCFVGSEHPFGERLGLVAVRWGAEDELLIMLGPERMDYTYHVPLIAKAAELLRN